MSQTGPVTTARKARKHLRPNPSGRAQHKRAIKPRSRRKDSVRALDMFSGCGGSSQGIEAAGIDVWYAANHWEYAVEIHERNHPGAEHFIADLVDTDATDYYHPEHLPAADLLWASPSCTNHSKANAERAYRRNLSLFDIGDDADYDDNVTTSERSRATAVSVLQYARKHRPKVIVVENVVEFAQWGVQVDGARKGDGSTFRWWLAEFTKLGYDTRVLFLNSMFFPPCPQSRDRMYVAMWDRSLRAPNLDHRPPAMCERCDTVVEARQAFKQRRGAWPLHEWGKYGDQYVYVCESCGQRVEPFALPALTALDLSDLGGRIADRDRPLAPATMARIARGVDKFGHWPPFLMPAKATHGVDRSSMRPMVTQTTQQELMMVHGFQVVAAGNTFERPGSTCRVRGLDQPMWSQHTTPSFGVVTFVDDWQGRATSIHEPLSTQLTSETHGVVALPFLHTARGSHEDRAAALQPVTDPLTVVTAGGNHHFLLTPLFAKQNGGPADTAWHQVTERLNTLLSVDTTCLLAPPAGELPPIAVEDCHYRMLKPTEIQLGMGLDPGFEMWGSARHRIKALGNAVTPPVSKWIVERMAALLR
jgi:DNA (cytosine-5)-methyltransferase 1